MYSADELVKINQWRQKVASNTMTQEDMIEAIKLLRQSRVGASQTSTASRTKKAAAKAPVNSDDLLSQLEGL